MRITTLAIALLSLLLFTGEAFAFPFLREEGPVFIVEIQSRPFSFPTDWSTPAVINSINSATGLYAVFVWNKAGKNIVQVFSGDDLEALMQTYRDSVFARVNKNVLRLEIGKNKIENGEVVEVQQ